MGQPSPTPPPREPNPQAIAWYVEQAEGLLDHLRSRAQSLRSRAGQLAGFAGAVVALVGGNADRIIGELCGTPRTIVGLMLLVGGLLLVAALVVSIIGAAFRPHLISGISAREIANYTTKRFTHEPDLWRVQIRTINGLLESIASTTDAGDKAANALRLAVLLFLAGVVAVGAALGILIWQVSV
jgi:hypothetical protein